VPGCLVSGSFFRKGTGCQLPRVCMASKTRAGDSVLGYGRPGKKRNSWIWPGGQEVLAAQGRNRVG